MSHESTQTKVDRKTQVGEQTERIDGAIDALVTNIGRLEDRLSYVILRPVEMPVGQKDEQPLLVLHAEILRTFADRLESASCRTRNLIENLEI